LKKYEEYGATYHGYVYGYPKLCKKYNRSKMSFNIVPRRALKLGWINNRFFESIFCNCLTFSDSSIVNIRDISDDYFLVGNSDEAEAKITEVGEMNKTEYECKLHDQYEKVKHLNYDFICSYLENIFLKYM
jgi:hypothetical protein